MTMKLLNTAQLATFLGISKNSLHNLMAKIRKGDVDPSCLPPWIVIGKKRMWLLETVNSWLRKPQVIGSNESEQILRSDHANQKNIIHKPSVNRKRGRPPDFDSLIPLI